MIECRKFEVLLDGWPLMGGEIVQKGDIIVVKKSVAHRLAVQCGAKLKPLGPCEVEKIKGVYYDIIKKGKEVSAPKAEPKEEKIPEPKLEDKVADRSMESKSKGRKKSKK